MQTTSVGRWPTMVAAPICASLYPTAVWSVPVPSVWFFMRTVQPVQLYLLAEQITSPVVLPQLTVSPLLGAAMARPTVLTAVMKWDVQSAHLNSSDASLDSALVIQLLLKHLTAS